MTLLREWPAYKRKSGIQRVRSSHERKLQRILVFHHSSTMTVMLPQQIVLRARAHYIGLYRSWINLGGLMFRTVHIASTPAVPSHPAMHSACFHPRNTFTPPNA